MGVLATTVHLSCCSHENRHAIKAVGISCLAVGVITCLGGSFASMIFPGHALFSHQIAVIAIGGAFFLTGLFTLYSSSASSATSSTSLGTQSDPEQQENSVSCESDTSGTDHPQEFPPSTYIKILQQLREGAGAGRATNSSSSIRPQVESTSMGDFAHVHDPIFSNILSYLNDFCDIGRCAQVCRLWRFLAYDQKVVEQMLRNTDGITLFQEREWRSHLNLPESVTFEDALPYDFIALLPQIAEFLRSEIDGNAGVRKRDKIS